MQIVAKLLIFTIDIISFWHLFVNLAKRNRLFQ